MLSVNVIILIPADVWSVNVIILIPADVRSVNVIILIRIMLFTFVAMVEDVCHNGVLQI